MLHKTLAVVLISCTYNFATAQILGGGTDFSNAQLFNQFWVTGCPAGGTTLSNQAAFEPNTIIDPCAPAPACVKGTAFSDVWFSFFAQSTTAKIVVNPSASFDIALQAFSGSSCPGLTDIGCADASGIGATEKLELTGLTVNQMYYFRVFGSANDLMSRIGSGTYTFCGSSQMGSSAIVLAVNINNFNATKQNGSVRLSWTAASESNNAYFEIERSSNGNHYQAVGKIPGAGTSSQATYYFFDDASPLTTGINYYRLKEVSSTGSYTYSSVVLIRPDNTLQKSITVLSNPITDKLSIKVSSDVATTMQLKVINNAGQVVYNQNGSVVKGDNIIAVTGKGGHGFEKGVYTLQVIIDKEILNSKFMSVQ